MSFQIVTRILVLAVLACGLLQAGEGRRIDSIPTVSYQIEGLSGPAEILIDPWGVPHIYASDQYDAFFVQGFNAARDRLWQLDLWRRRGLGLLSEVFGEEYLEKDRASRLFLYRKDMYSEWLFYGSDAKRIATSFVGGVNAYIGLTREHADLLPWEYRELISLRHYGELSYDEIAKLKEMPLGTVKNKLFRGRQMLKEKLRDFLTD